MAKVISAYRGFTATDVKNKSTSGVGTYTVAGSTVNTNNITVSGIKTALSASVNSLGALCTSNNINRWSGYSPIIRSVGGSAWERVLVNSVPTTNFKMGDFAGYNHNAAAPNWKSGGLAAAQADVWINAGTKPTVISDLMIEELRYEGATGVVLVAFDQFSSIMAYGTLPLSTLKYEANLTALGLANQSVQDTWTLKSYIYAGTISSWEDIQSAILYRVPNVSNATVTIKIKQPSEWHYGNTDNQTVPSPWVQNGGAGMNWTTGYFDIGWLQANVTYTNLRVYATLYDWTYTQIGTNNIYNAPYNALDDVIGSAYLNMTNIPNYGYHVVVEFQITI